jgi:hypothetical protein
VQTALCSHVYKIEKALKDGIVTQGVFLDVESEFDNTTFESMCRAVEKHGV